MLVIRCAECNHAELSANPDCQCGCHVAAIPDTRDTELATLRAALATANKRVLELENELKDKQEHPDTRRLDWLATNLAYLTMVNGNNNVMYTLPNRGMGWKNNELRAAIDAATKKAKNE